MRNLKPRLHHLILLAATKSILGCDTKPHPPLNASTTPAAATTQIRIDNFTYTPATLTVSPGTTVTWTNHDDVPHTVTADDKAFASKALDTDDTYSHTFATPGTYPYFCAVHPHMTGQIIVK